MGFLADLTISFYLKPQGYNRAWLGNIYFLAELLFLSFYFKKHLPEKVNKQFVFFIVIAATAFVVRTVDKSVFALNTADASALNLLYMLYGFAGFYLLLKQRKVKLLETSGYFWANVAFVIYYSGNFIIFLFVEHLSVADVKSLHSFWIIIHGSLNIVYRLFLTLSLVQKND